MEEDTRVDSKDKEREKAESVEEEETVNEKEVKGRLARMLDFARTPRAKLYASYALSTWGDRSWSFAVSLSLYEVGGNLLLPALSNALNSIVVIVFGVVIGRWIDRTPRLKASRAVLAANNSTTALSGICLVGALWAETWLKSSSMELYWAVVVLGVTLSAASQLAGAATKIVVARDWTAVLAEGSAKRLATINAGMVLIDHVCGILSPLLAGQIMASADIAAGALFVASWNVVSFPLELFLLARVYAAIPALADARDEIKETPLMDMKLQNTGQEDMDPSQPDSQPPTHRDSNTPPGTNGRSTEKKEAGGKKGCLGEVGHYATGWGLYGQHAVFPAAFALALLYLTVLGLDGITSAYVLSQGLGPNLIALFQAVGALLGICGGLAFPFLRSRLGLGWAGVLGLSWHCSAISVAVASVFMPGSPFHLLPPSPTPSLAIDAVPIPPNVTTATSMTTMDTVASVNGTTEPTLPHSLTSIWTFLVSVSVSRFGLWLTDLTITQTMQELIAEAERGVLFGVHSSAQQFFSLFKDIMVTALPEIPYFGYHIIISFFALLSSLVSYLVFICRDINKHQPSPSPKEIST